MESFGSYIHACREALRQKDKRFSLRQVAGRIGVEPSYLSRLERGDYAPLSEAKLRALAEDLGQDPDVILAMNGKISEDVQQIIIKRPQLFADLLRSVKEMPDSAVLRIVREVRDGNW